MGLNIIKPLGYCSETINRALIYHAANKYMPKFTLNFASNALEVNYYQKCLDSLGENSINFKFAYKQSQTTVNWQV